MWLAALAGVVTIGPMRDFQCDHRVLFMPWAGPGLPSAVAGGDAVR